MSSRLTLARARRHELRLPIGFRFGRGVTRNISSSGVLFEAGPTEATRLVPGQILALDISLVLDDGRPAFGSAGPLRLEAAGHVLRVEPRPSGVLIAVVMTALRFSAAPRRPTPAPAP